jgi:hypothetical protein
MQTLIASIAVSFVIASSCIGDLRDFDKRIEVTPSNAKAYSVRFSYHKIAELVKIEMPAVQDGADFHEATLTFEDGTRSLIIPIASTRMDQDILLSFWANRIAVRDCLVRIRFRRKDDIKGILMVIETNKFIGKEQ